MIKLLRVDHRLLHGQVAFNWAQNLGIDCILIANDAVPEDELRKTTLQLAKPQGVKLVIKNVENSVQALNSGVTDKYKLFIIVETIHDAFRLAREVPAVTDINLGGTKPHEGTRAISKTVSVSEQDAAELRELADMGRRLEIRQIPGDSPQDPLKLI